MQVFDLLNQYQNNLSSGSEISVKTKGIEQLVETAKQLKTGNIFEGTVNSVRGSEVILGLSSGQNITARLDAGLSLVKGQSVFFQVKYNDGEQIRIKPVSLGGDQSNPTLLKALDSAGLAVSERNLNMVNAMMKEQMSIDAKSLQNMARSVATYQNASPENIVQMQKTGLTISADALEQFDMYKENQSEVLGQIKNVASAISSAFSQEDLSLSDAVTLNKNLVSFFTDASKGENEASFETSKNSLAKEQNPLSDKLQGKAQEVAWTETDTDFALSKDDFLDLQKKISNLTRNAAFNMDEPSFSTDSKEGMDTFAPGSKEGVDTFASGSKEGESLGAAGAKEDMDIFTSGSKEDAALGTAGAKEDVALGSAGAKDDAALGSAGAKEGAKILASDMLDKTGLDSYDFGLKDKNESEILRKLSNFLEDHISKLPQKEVKELLESKPYKKLLESVILDKWTATTEDLTKEKSISNLYEKMKNQLLELENLVSKYPKIQQEVQNTTRTLGQNIDFMNQMNQMYSYVQVPLRMYKQNVNSELFVYRNKQNVKDSDELSAFLHFSMEALGDVDISVKMQQKNVTMQWYLGDENSLTLLEQNVHLLENRLNELGYNCSLSFAGEEKNVNFVEDFLMADKKTGGEVHRYSFDVRA